MLLPIMARYRILALILQKASEVRHTRRPDDLGMHNAASFEALLKGYAKCTVLRLVSLHRRLEIGRNMKNTWCIFSAMHGALSSHSAAPSLAYETNIHPAHEGGPDATGQA